MTRARLFACALFLLSMVQQAAADETAADSPASAAASSGDKGLEVRKVWVLQEPTGYGSEHRTRQITVYEVVCEEGKMTRAAETFQTATAPAFGSGWVLRTQSGPDGEVSKEQLQRALSDVCGV